MMTDRCFRLSLAQEAIWLFQQLHPNSTAYHIPSLFHLNGTLDVPAFRRSVKAVLRRHESLRTTFHLDQGIPVQRVCHQSTVTVEVEEIAGADDSARQSALRRRIRQELDTPFDLEKGPLLRLGLFKIAPAEHALLIIFHHIVADGWSVGVFHDEVSRLYSAYTESRPSPLIRLTTRYSAFAEGQRKRLTSEALTREFTFWKDQLAGISTVLNLPTDHPRPAVATHHGAIERIEIPESLVRAIRSSAQQQRATPFMILLAAFQILLARYTGQSDFVIGSPMSGRTEVALEPLIGNFANIVPLRADLSDDPSFATLVARVRQRVLVTYSHQELPLDKLVSELKVPPSLSYQAFGQVLFVVQNAGRAAFNLPKLQIKNLEFDWTTARTDLSLILEDSGHQVGGNFEYSTDLFNAETVRRFVAHYIAILSASVANPAQRLSTYGLVTPAEREQVLTTWNTTARNYPQDRCAHQLIEEQVRQTPDAIALVSGEQRWTYTELDALANQFGHFLQEYGIRAEARVCVHLHRTLDWMALVLGLMKTGAVYVPIDPTIPPARAAYIAADAGATLIVTDSAKNQSDWPAGARVLELDRAVPDIRRKAISAPIAYVSPRNLAYIIYTSGSTGRPKGVAIEHRSLVNLKETQEPFGIGASDRVLQFSSSSFDASIFEIFLALTRGATLVLRPAEPIAGSMLIDLLESERISATLLPPSILAAAPPRPLPALKLLMIGGESAVPEVYANWSAHRRLWNLYGPTEVTVWGTGTDSASVTDPSNIGSPVANTQTYVLNSALQPSPVGMPDELYIAGPGVARGYWNQPALTAAAFLPDPFSAEPGARMYRTGDRVRWRPDGKLDFLGRVDQQIKVRGFRIEPGEIETVLNSHPAIQTSAVVKENRDPQRLVAFLVLREGMPRVAESEIRSYLKTQLPEFMVPTALVMLESLPLGSTGKVDRRALAAFDIPLPSPAPNCSAALNRTEEMVAGVWQQLLSRSDIALDENFFDAGGNSLLMVRLFNTLKNMAGPRLTIADLFQYPTIASLAAYLGDRDSAEVSSIHADSEKLPPQITARLRLQKLRARRP